MLDWGGSTERYGRIIMGDSMDTGDPETSIYPDDIIVFAKGGLSGKS